MSAGHHQRAPAFFVESRGRAHPARPRYAASTSSASSRKIPLRIKRAARGDARRDLAGQRHRARRAGCSPSTTSNGPCTSPTGVVDTLMRSLDRVARGVLT